MMSVDTTTAITPAVIYIPSAADLREWLTICLDAADRHGWYVAALARRWSDAARRAAEHEAILLVATRAHLTSDRLPRMVVADELTPPPRANRADRVR